MNEIARNLAKELVGKVERLKSDERLLVGIAGIPASGKTTLSHMIVDCINHLTENSDYLPGKAAILVGLDGWHLAREQLRAMSDPKLAFDRRGAHWTFDPVSYLSFVKQLRQPIRDSAEAIKAPSFDHALKDPLPDAIHILPFHRVIIIEGLYVLLSSAGWKQAAELLDERWLIDINIEEARRRLVKRHVATTVASDEDEACWRADNNDMPNGVFLLANMVPPTKRIQSIEDTSCFPDS